jgi:hypothetical protein
VSAFVCLLDEFEYGYVEKAEPVLTVGVTGLGLLLKPLRAGEGARYNYGEHGMGRERGGGMVFAIQVGTSTNVLLPVAGGFCC